jgi:DNA processing protein
MPASAFATDTSVETSDNPLLGLIGPVPVPEDLLIRELGRPAAAISAELLDLELAGLVQRHPGGMVSRLFA